MKRLLDLRNLALLGLTVVALAGCDALAAPKLTLSADRTTIAAGGHEHAEITATVLKKTVPAAGKTVTFETEFGSFHATMEVTSIDVTTDSDGLAVVPLYSSVDQGQTEVVATYEDEESGLDAVARITITFGPPQAGNLPVDGRFQLECSHLNVGALRDPKPDIIVPCNLTAQTVGGDVLSVESIDVFYLAEAGTLATIHGETDYNVVYSVQGGHSGPEDVAPVSSEPVRTGSLGEEYNPRDGVVTLVAITKGTESWIDSNQNGVRDSNEQHTPTVEPFLDTNDNGEYDPGEEYFDTNNDGEWTGDNGQFDGDTYIWTWTKVIWTGELREATDAARLETDSPSNVIGDGGQINLRAWLLDKHMNPIAAFSDPSDYLELSENSGNLEFNPDYNVSLEERLGMRFDNETGGIMEFYYNDGCSPQAGCYQITVYDGSPGYVEDPPIPFIISVNVWATPGPNVTDWVNQRTTNFVQNITGTTE